MWLISASSWIANVCRQRWIDTYHNKNVVCERCTHDYNGSRIDEYDICKRCKDMGRICTWTRAIEECPLDDPKVLAILPQPPNRDMYIVDMPDAGLLRQLDLYETI